MKARLFHIDFALSLTLGCMAFAQQDGYADSVAHKLFSGARQLQPWADEMENAKPETLAEAWDVMEILLRAERDEAVLRLIPKAYALVLKEGVFGRDASRPHSVQSRSGESPEEWMVRHNQAEQKRKLWEHQKQIAEALCKLPARRLKLCLAFFETFDTVCAPQRDKFFNEYLVSSMREMGWDDEQILDWVSARYHSALTREEEWSDIFQGRNTTMSYLQVLWPMSHTAEEWQRCYQYDCLPGSPRRDEILLRSMEEARGSPDDMKKLVLFLVSFSNSYLKDAPTNVDWLVETIGERTPLTAWIIAKSMDYYWMTKAMGAREAFLKRALSEPLTAEDLATLRKIVMGLRNASPESPSDELLQAMFWVEVIDDLNEIYFGLKRIDDIQRILPEAQELRKKYNLRDGSFWGGNMMGWRRTDFRLEKDEAQEKKEALRRRADAIESFKAKRAVVKQDIAALVELYRGDPEWLYKDARAELTEDLRNAYTWLKTTPKEESREYRDAAYNNVALFMYQFLAALHFGILDFENDPLAWEVLAMISKPYDMGPYIYLLLFPEKARMVCEYRMDGIQPPGISEEELYEHVYGNPFNKNITKKTPDKKALQKLKDLVNRKALSTQKIHYGICKILDLWTTDYENVNWFLLAALQQAREDYERKECYPLLISNTLRMGDWENSEKYITQAEELGVIYVDKLRQAADLAEKAGATEAAQRMRERIKNFGTFP